MHAEQQSGLAAGGPGVVGVICQLGGQTPLGLALKLERAGVPIVGTSPASIDLAEHRGAFGKVLARAGLRAPAHGTATSFPEAKLIADEIGYPVLVRPSYVLGGRGMKIVYDDQTLAAYVGEHVIIRYDPRDMAEIRVFHNHRFLCRAICAELAGETIALREIALHPRDAFLLERFVADREHLVGDQYVRLQRGRDREAEPHDHAGRVMLDRVVDVLAQIGELLFGQVRERAVHDRRLQGLGVHRMGGEHHGRDALVHCLGQQTHPIDAHDIQHRHVYLIVLRQLDRGRTVRSQEQLVIILEHNSKRLTGAFLVIDNQQGRFADGASGFDLPVRINLERRR